MTLDLSRRSRLDALPATLWDAIVIGAGVAGASFAIEAAKRNKSVLLVEADRFPRDKVCGGCLNPRAQSHLEALGVLAKLQDAGAVYLNRITIGTSKHTVRWTTPSMLSIRRSTLDTILVERAIELGVTFVDGVRGKIVESPKSSSTQSPEVHLDSGDTQINVNARIVVVASGLTRSPISQDSSWAKWVDPKSRIGASTLLNEETYPIQYRALRSLLRSGDQSPQLYMLSGRAGYVGICETDANYIDVATAIAPDRIKGQNGLTVAVQSIFDECKFNCLLTDSSLRWHATSALTRTSSLAAKDGVFLLGDSLGYVEPFTGEGMSWAMSAANQLANLMEQEYLEKPGSAERRWNQWVNAHRSSKQSVARWVAKMARNGFFANLTLGLLDHVAPARNALLKKAMQ